MKKEQMIYAVGNIILSAVVVSIVLLFTLFSNGNYIANFLIKWYGVIYWGNKERDCIL